MCEYVTRNAYRRALQRNHAWNTDHKDSQSVLVKLGHFTLLHAMRECSRVLYLQLSVIEMFKAYRVPPARDVCMGSNLEMEIANPPEETSSKASAEHTL
jgi:hypothetical protein